MCAGAPEFGIGAVPGAFEGGDLALDADEEFGGGGLGEEYGGEGVAGRFGEDGVVEVSLDALEAALLPIGAEHGSDVEGFGGGLGAELLEVVVGQGVVIGGVFAGDDDGGGVDAVLESVEAGGGLALGGAGPGRFLRVGAICGDLSWGSHDYDLARLREKGKKKKCSGNGAVDHYLCLPIQLPKTRSATDLRAPKWARPPAGLLAPCTMLTDCAGSGSRGTRADQGVCATNSVAGRGLY